MKLEGIPNPPEAASSKRQEVRARGYGAEANVHSQHHQMIFKVGSPLYLGERLPGFPGDGKVVDAFLAAERQINRHVFC